MADKIPILRVDAVGVPGSDDEDFQLYGRTIGQQALKYALPLRPNLITNNESICLPADPLLPDVNRLPG